MGQQPQDFLWGQVAGQGLQVQIPISFGQTAAVWRQEHGYMVIAGLRSAQKLLQVHLTGGRREKVPPPDHLRDPGRGIVHHHGQLIYEYSIRPADHKIAAVPGKIFYVLALNSVPEGDLPVRYPNPPGGQAAKGGPLLRLSIPAPAVIYIDAIGGVRSVNPVQAAAGLIPGCVVLKLWRFTPR